MYKINETHYGIRQYIPELGKEIALSNAPIEIKDENGEVVRAVNPPTQSEMKEISQTPFAFLVEKVVQEVSKGKKVVAENDDVYDVAKGEA